MKERGGIALQPTKKWRYAQTSETLNESTAIRLMIAPALAWLPSLLSELALSPLLVPSSFSIPAAAFLLSAFA